jgi:tRNA uridine 5-carbamoylmethylation protein Kti12
MTKQEESKKFEAKRRESRDKIQQAIFKIAREKAEAVKELSEINIELPKTLALLYLQGLSKEDIEEFKAKQAGLKKFINENHKLIVDGLVILRNIGYIIDDTPRPNQDKSKECKELPS